MSREANSPLYKEKLRVSKSRISRPFRDQKGSFYLQGRTEEMAGEWNLSLRRSPRCPHKEVSPSDRQRPREDRYVPESYESWQWRIESWCHLLWMAGSGHVTEFSFFLVIMLCRTAGKRILAERVRCEVIPGGALDTKGRVNKIMELKVNAMTGTPRIPSTSPRKRWGWVLTRNPSA